MKRAVQVPVLLFVWSLVGLVVALANNYGEINSGSDAWSLVLAIIVWPLILFGADVSIRF